MHQISFRFDRFLLKLQKEFCIIWLSLSLFRSSCASSKNSIKWCMFFTRNMQICPTKIWINGSKPTIYMATVRYHHKWICVTAQFAFLLHHLRIFNRFMHRCRCDSLNDSKHFPLVVCAHRGHSTFSFCAPLLCCQSQKPPNHCLRRRVKNANLHAWLMCLKQIAICTCFDVTYVRRTISRWTFPSDEAMGFSWKKWLIACQLLVQMHSRKSLNFIDLWNESGYLRTEIDKQEMLWFRNIRLIV